MIGYLYRYVHPLYPDKHIYVGQGNKRDWAHRTGKSSFGRRFKTLFPDIELPQPIRERVDVENSIDLNELETIWMFRYHTWCGYVGGMNLTFPGSIDYGELARSGGLVVTPKQRSVCGKLLEKYRTKEHQQKAGRLGGRITSGIPGHAKRRGFASRDDKTGIFNLDFNRSLGGVIAGSKLKNKERCAIMGQLSGIKNSESGLLMKNNHIRWHLTKGILNPRCAFCSEENLIVAYA